MKSDIARNMASMYILTVLAEIANAMERHAELIDVGDDLDALTDRTTFRDTAKQLRVFIERAKS